MVNVEEIRTLVGPIIPHACLAITWASESEAVILIFLNLHVLVSVFSEWVPQWSVMTSVPVSSRYRSLYMGDDGRCTFCPPTTMMRRPQASAQWLLLGDGGSPWGDMALVCVWKIEGNPPWHPLLFSKWNCEDKKCVNLSRPLFRLPLRSCTHSLQYLFLIRR